MAAGLWSVTRSAPVTVPAQGILLSASGIIDVNAPDPGRIAEIRGQINQIVRAGDTVAVMSQAEAVDAFRTKELTLAGLRAERERLMTFQQQVNSSVQRLNADRAAGQAARIASLSQRAESLGDLERNTRDLREKGYALNARLLAVTQDLDHTRDELRNVRSQSGQMANEEGSLATRDARELLGVDLRIAGVERELDVLNGRLSRSTLITAPQDGRIVELTATVNEVVAAGRPVMRMLPAGGPETLQGVLFVPAEAGKRVRPGMTVQVVPANARLQRDGYMRARVLAVSDLPATREGMLRVLKNEALVQQLSAKGPPYEVTVALERDPASATGFAWSTGRGLPTPPESGTTVDAKLVVERVPVIEFVLPRLATILPWLKPTAP